MAVNATERKTEEKIPIYPLLLINFIGTMGISLVLPFLIFLVERFGGNAIIYGVIVSMYPAFQLIGAPLLGKMSDRSGRKKILFISQLGTLFSWIIFFIALLIPVIALKDIDSKIIGSFVITVPLIMLFIARGLDGLTGGNVSVSNAYIADITDDKDRSSNYGKMAVSTNLGFIMGPAIAGILSTTIYGEVLPVLAAILISIAGTVLIAYYLPESRQYIQDESIPGKLTSISCRTVEDKDLSPLQKQKLADIMNIRHIPYIFFIYFLIFLAFNSFYVAFPVHAANKLEWTIAELGLFFSFLSIMLVLVEGPVLTKISKKVPDTYLIIAGSFILATSFIFLVSTETRMAYVAAVLFALGNGLMWPSLQSILSKLAGKEKQGLVHGISGSFMSLASILGLVGGGIAYELMGAKAFFVPVIIIYIVFVLSLRIRSFDKK